MRSFSQDDHAAKVNSNDGTFAAFGVRLGDTVRHKLAPAEDAVKGLVVKLSVSMTEAGIGRFVNVQWVDHSGTPGKIEEHLPGELVVVL